MRLRTIYRLCGAGLLALGLPTLFTAQWGALWQPGTVEYLGWSQLYVLRPGMYATGAVATGLGLWQLWLRNTTPGMVLRRWREDVLWDRELDERYATAYADDPDYQRATWRDDLANLWYRRGCLIGRHDPKALEYCVGGEDGPRGTTCVDCGLGVLTPDWLRKQTLDQREDQSRRMYDGLIAGDGGHDPLRHVQPDDGCYTQGSDPVFRCDKES